MIEAANLEVSYLPVRRYFVNTVLICVHSPALAALRNVEMLMQPCTVVCSKECFAYFFMYFFFFMGGVLYEYLSFFITSGYKVL